MQLEIIQNILILATGAAICIQDFLRRMVNLLVLLIFTLSCCSKFFFGCTPCYYPFIIIIITGIAYHFIKRRKAFGSADYIVAFAISFMISSENWHIFLTLCGGFGALIGIIQRSRKEENIPFIPAILFAVAVTTLVFS
ncbi:MAG: hypothetical protein LBI20_00125 [Holosporales bacterium]|jgi:hypothetical protein|nr:hypothetical protein [Holosporales bacterium]